jgi:hypothetical protein
VCAQDVLDTNKLDLNKLMERRQNLEARARAHARADTSQPPLPCCAQSCAQSARLLAFEPSLARARALCRSRSLTCSPRSLPHCPLCPFRDLFSFFLEIRSVHAPPAIARAQVRFLEQRQARSDDDSRALDRQRVQDAEDYAILKIRLETEIQTLEQNLEEMRATYQVRGRRRGAAGVWLRARARLRGRRQRRRQRQHGSYNRSGSSRNRVRVSGNPL